MYYLEPKDAIYIDDEEVYALFPEQYLGHVPNHIIEMDDELGLEIVPTQTIEEKYGLIAPLADNDFCNSLKKQFEAKGYLSPKQVACLRK